MEASIDRPAAGDSAAGAATSGTPGKSTLTQRLSGLGGGGGDPLPGPARDRFEASLGADLGGVRVHTGAASASAADAVGARAFTTGNDIHFGAGEYRPEDPFGMHLLAHEVAHTRQQGGGAGSPQYKLEVSQPGDPAEHEADRAADAMVAGEPAWVSLIGGAPIQRDAKPGEASSSGDDKEIASLKGRYDTAVGLVTAKFGLMATQQSTGVKDLIEPAKKEDSSLTQTVLIKAVETGVALAMPAVGEELTAAIKSPLGQKAMKWAFDKAKDYAKDAAKDKVKESYKPDKGADSFFNGLALTYPAVAGRQQKQWADKMRTEWEAKATTASAAHDLVEQAEHTEEDMQKKLESNSYVKLTNYAAVDAWATAIAQKNLGLNYSKPGEAGTDMFKAGEKDGWAMLSSGNVHGVLHLTVQVNKYGPQLPKILKAELPGISSELLKSTFADINTATGRNLAALKMPKHINVQWGSVATPIFSGGVNELGVVWIDNIMKWKGIDPKGNGLDKVQKDGFLWLFLRGGGKDPNPNVDDMGPGTQVPFDPEPFLYKGMEALVNVDMATLTLGGLF